MIQDPNKNKTKKLPILGKIVKTMSLYQAKKIFNRVKIFLGLGFFVCIVLIEIFFLSVRRPQISLQLCFKRLDASCVSVFVTRESTKVVWLKRTLQMLADSAKFLCMM